MDPIHLPPDAVRFINALTARPDEPAPDQAVEAFRALIAAARKWLDFHGTFSLDDDEAGLLQNLPYHWDDVEAALEQGTCREILADAVPPLYRAIHAMDTVIHGRDSARFSRQPAINDFILAGSMWLEGRGESRAVQERAPVLEAYCENLETLYHSSSERLRPEVAREFDKGFAYLRQAMGNATEAARTGNIHLLRGALADLAKTDSVVQHFLDWKQREQEQFATRYNRFHIPLVGSSLEQYLESARSLPRTGWIEGAQALGSTLVPRLQSVWAQRRPVILVPSGVREEILAAVDVALERLEDAVAHLLDEEVPEAEVLQDLEDALQTLSDAFDAVHRRALDPTPLAGTQAETYWEVISGLLDETMPDMALQELLQACPPRENWGPVVDGIRTYLESGEVETVCDIAEALLATVQVQPREDCGWACVFCGHENRVGDATCDRCHRHSQVEVALCSSWEA